MIVVAAANCAHRAGRPVEDREHAVASAIHETASISVDFATDKSEVLRFEVSPTKIADIGDMCGGVDNVGKQHRREHAVRLWMVTRPSKEFFQLSDQGFCISHVGQVVHARELDEPCARKAPIRQRDLQYSSGGWTKSPSTKIAEPRRLACVPSTNPNCSIVLQLLGRD